MRICPSCGMSKSTAVHLCTLEVLEFLRRPAVAPRDGPLLPPA